MLSITKTRFSGKKIIILFLIMTASVFSQGWNTAVQTTIPFSSVSKVDLTTNRDGNHILVTYDAHPTYYLRYYLVNSSGAVVRNYTFENQYVQFASIDGTDDRIYVVYKLGNQIKTRKSTNAGISWTNDSNILPINIGNNTCNHIDISFGKDDNALHVVWATQDAGSDYKTYYKRLDVNNAWGSTEPVTDGSNVGSLPTVSKSPNRVHVSYTVFDYPAAAMTRDKLNANWQNPQVAFNGQSWRDRVHAGTSKLFNFYYKLEGGMGQVRADLYVTERSFTGTTWPAGTFLHASNGIDHIVSATNSNDGKTHIIYDGYNSVVYRSYGGSSWSSEYTVGTGYISPKISSVSNDIYVVWGRDWPVQNQYVQYRQYDAVPLAPQNLAVSVSSNNRPLLNWSRNNEPDIQHYKIYKWTYAELGWFHYATTTSTSFEDVNEIIQSGGAHANERWVYYRVTAVDQYPQESPNSNQVGIKVKGAALDKFSTGTEVYDYSLSQNYPNPFNPSTKISYSIKEDGFVTLKVYDILGVEIATLVNEHKTAGIYEAVFNAANLPSGMYVYKLHAGSFTEVKKMLLTK